MARDRRTFGRVLRRKRHGVYLPGFYIRFRKGDKEVTRWAGPDRKTAHELLADLLRKTSRADLLGEKSVPAVTFDAIKSALASYLEGRHERTTFERERGRLDRITLAFGTRALRDVTPGDVQDFLGDLRDQRRKPAEGKPRRLASVATRNRYAALLAACFRFAVEKGYAIRNPVAGIKRPREEAKAVPFLSSADVDRIIAATPDSLLRAFVRVLADAGLRRGEALALSWRDVDSRRGAILVRRSKAKRPREVPMTLAVRAALDALRDTRGPVPLTGPDPVWPALVAVHPSVVSVKVERAAKRAGFDGLRLHDLRHGFCSRLAQAGVPLPTIAALAGHADYRVTQRYASHLPGGALVDAVKALDPAPAKAADGTPTRANRRAEGDAKGDAASRADATVSTHAG